MAIQKIVVHALKIVTPSPIIELLLKYLSVPASPAWQQSNTKTLFFTFDLLHHCIMSSILMPFRPNLFVDALNGSAADILGQITPGSVYAHIDQSLGAWSQLSPIKFFRFLLVANNGHLKLLAYKICYSLPHSTYVAHQHRYCDRRFC